VPDKLVNRVEYEAQRVRDLEALEPFVVQAVRAERAIIMGAITLCQGNEKQAAERLGISRGTLWRKLGGRKRTGSELNQFRMYRE
jgi:DNA-binding NtrC family response regulator